MADLPQATSLDWRIEPDGALTLVFIADDKPVYAAQVAPDAVRGFCQQTLRDLDASSEPRRPDDGEVEEALAWAAQPTPYQRLNPERNHRLFAGLAAAHRTLQAQLEAVREALKERDLWLDAAETIIDSASDGFVALKDNYRSGILDEGLAAFRKGRAAVAAQEAALADQSAKGGENGSD